MDDTTQWLINFEPKLLDYLTQRFGSAPLARGVAQRVREQLSQSEVLSMIAEPEVYVLGYALALGLHWPTELASASKTAIRSGTSAPARRSAPQWAPRPAGAHAP